MKLYKTLLLLLIFLGGIFIGTSDPVKNMYKNSAAIITSIMDYDNNKIEEKDKSNKQEKFVICIDPGHQSKGDPTLEPIAPSSPYQKARVSSGTCGVGTKKPEYELNLEASLILKHILVSKGFNVIMTRESHDVNISNVERAIYANENNANLVVRIHGDSSDNPSITGVSILVPAQNSKYTSSIFEDSNKCATDIKSKMSNEGIKVNGVFERDDLTGFNWSRIPVVLVEMGFMSNYNEDQMLSNPDYQKKMMQCVADGVEEYFKTN